MSDIADQIGYSVEHTWRLHTLAIKEFQKILEKDNKSA